MHQRRRCEYSGLRSCCKSAGASRGWRCATDIGTNYHFEGGRYCTHDRHQEKGIFSRQKGSGDEAPDAEVRVKFSKVQISTKNVTMNTNLSTRAEMEMLKRPRLSPLQAQLQNLSVAPAPAQLPRRQVPSVILAQKKRQRSQSGGKLRLPRHFSVQSRLTQILEGMRAQAIKMIA